MTVVPDEYCEMQFLYSGPSSTGGGMWTLGWSTGGVTDDTADPDLIAAWEPLVSEQLSGEVVWDTLRLVFGTADPSAPVVRDVPAGVSGASVQGLPMNCAFLVQKRSNMGGRKNRGRMYLPGVPEDALTAGNQLASGSVEDLQLAVDAAVTATQLAFASGGAPTSQGAILHAVVTETPTLIQSYSVSNTLVTQRKRLTP